MDDHISRLKTALAAEKQETDTAYQAQLQLSPAEQRRQGILLFPLVIVSQDTVGSRTLVSFKTSFPINEAYFRKGAAIRYRCGDAVGEGRLIELSERDGSFTVFEEDPPNFREEAVQLQFAPDDRTHQCMELGLRLAETHPVLQQMIQELNAPVQEETIADSQLNENQRKAAANILSERLVTLIQGPPGTGKTHTLAKAIQELVSQKKQVVICAPSNMAVDHLCHQLLDKNIPLLRVGNEEKMSDRVEAFTIDGYLERGPEKRVLDQLRKDLRKADDQANKFVRNFTKEAAAERQSARKERNELRKAIRKMEQDAREHLLSTIPVIAGTPVGLFNELSKTFTADVVILDEAGQCPEPLTWLVASFGKRLVLCGDPQQLPPVVFSRKAQQLGLQESLIERAMTAENTVLLTDQYRMAPEIVAGINPYFYQDALQTVFKDRIGSLTFIDMAGYGEGEQQDESSGSTYNPDEAKLVATIIRHHGFGPTDTVVLSPYNAQLEQLKQQLGKSWKIATVDAIQGQEAENIVISLTRSNAEQEIGFLKDYRRTNVAISRAKTYCILIGDSATIGNDPFYSQLIGLIETAGGYKSAWEFYEE